MTYAIILTVGFISLLCYLIGDATGYHRRAKEELKKFGNEF